MNAIDKITASLQVVFAPLEAKVLADSIKWAEGRVAAIAAYHQNTPRGGCIVTRHEGMFAAAGGVTWYKIFSGRGKAEIEAYMVKNCAALAEKRNAGIAAKLARAGVTEVVSEEFTDTVDGFDGVFIVNTDSGRKVVTVNTIVAGGYNIQCAHMRILTKVK